MKWRWDQGRLLYFQFGVLKQMSKVISALSGSDKAIGADILRTNLENHTGLPFAPANYTV